MKKKIAFALIISLCLSMTGCFVENVPLTVKEQEIISQYAADVLLEHDTNHDPGTVDPMRLTPTPSNTPTPTDTPTPTKTPKPGTPTPDPNATPSPRPTATNTPTPTPFPSNTSETWAQLAKVIGAEEFDVRFVGASEPEKSFTLGDSFYPLSTVKGYEHLAVKIQIRNTSEETKYLDVNRMEIKSVLYVNGDPPVNDEITLFPNELRYIGLQSGGQGEAVAPWSKYNGENGAIIVFLIPEGIDIDRAGLLITNKNGDEVLIKIQ